MRNNMGPFRRPGSGLGYLNFYSFPPLLPIFPFSIFPVDFLLLLCLLKHHFHSWIQWEIISSLRNHSDFTVAAVPSIIVRCEAPACGRQARRKSCRTSHRAFQMRIAEFGLLTKLKFIPCGFPETLTAFSAFTPLEIRPALILKIIPLLIPLLEGTTLSPFIDPSRSRPFTSALNLTRLL